MKTFLGIVIIFAGLSSRGAIPPKNLSVESALRLPPTQRLTALRKIGPSSYRDLHTMAFDPAKSYDLRWRAVVAMAWLGKKESFVDLERALTDKDWFMRDAALKGLQKTNKEKAGEWATRLLSDPALVVRSAAVKVIADLHVKSAEEILWEKINAPENFRGEQGLFVRRQMLSALVEFASIGSEEKFAKYLFDKDRSLHFVAVEGLERLNGSRKDEDRRKSYQIWKKQYARLGQ